jgi:CheY-like chemotaxis protein
VPKENITVRKVNIDTRKEEKMSRHVLVVDDNQCMRLLLQELLEDETYEVDTSYDGLDALERMDYQQGKYDAIVLDLMRPRLNGLQFLHKIQQRKSTLLSSVIIISDDVEVHQQAACMGINNTLRKPFDIEMLLAMVARMTGLPREESMLQVC